MLMKIVKLLNEFVGDKNSCIKLLEEDFWDKIVVFVNFLWFYFYEIFKEYIIENFDEVIVNILCVGFMGCIIKFYKFFILFFFYEYVRGFFNSIYVSCLERIIVIEIGMMLFEKFFG